MQHPGLNTLNTYKGSELGIGEALTGLRFALSLGMNRPRRTPGSRYGALQLHLSFEGQRPRPPGVSTLSFRTQPLDLRFRTLMDTDFVIIRRLVRPWRLLYPVPVRRLVRWFRTSFRPHLAMTPLCFPSLYLHQVGRGTSTLRDSVPARHANKTSAWRPKLRPPMKFQVSGPPAAPPYSRKKLTEP